MANASLVFDIDLSALNKALDAVNGSANKIKDNLNKAFNSVKDSYQTGLKLNLPKAQLDEVKNKLKEATKAKVKLDIDEATAKIDKMKLKIVAAVGALAVLRAPVKTAIDFEKAMVDVKKVTNFSADEFKHFSNEIIALTREVPKSMNELASISFEGAKLGIAQEQLLDYTKLVAQMANAFEMSTSEAGSNIANLKNVFKLKDIKEVEKLGDYINYIADTSNTSVPKVISVLNDVGAAGEMLNLNAQNLVNLGGAMTSLSIPANEASTSMSKIFSVLAGAKKATSSAKWAFKELGIDVEDMQSAFEKDGEGTLIKFLEKLKGLDRFKRAEIIKALFGQEHINNVSTLVKGLDEYKENVKKAADKTAYLGGIQREDARQKETLAYQIEILKNNFAELGQKIGVVFLPFLKQASNAISKLTNFISSAATKFPNFTLCVGGAIGALTSLYSIVMAFKIFKTFGSIIFGGLRLAILSTGLSCVSATGSIKGCIAALSLQNIWAKLTTASMALYKAMIVGVKFTLMALNGIFKAVAVGARLMTAALISSGIGAIIVAIGAAIALVYYYWDDLVGYFKRACAFLAPIFKNIGEVIKNSFDQAVKWVTGIFTKFFNWIDEKIKSITEIFTNIKKGFDDVTKGAKDALGIGDGKEKNWYNPFSWFNDEKQDTKGDVKELKDSKNTKSQVVNDNKTVNVYMQNSSATPENVAKAVENSSYRFKDSD